MTEISNKKMDFFLKTQQSECPELRDVFMSICRTVEKFSQYDQAVVKKKILDIVTDTQIEQLRVESNAQTNIQTPINGFYANYGMHTYGHSNHPPFVSNPPPSIHDPYNGHQMPNNILRSNNDYHITEL